MMVVRRFFQSDVFITVDFCCREAMLRPLPSKWIRMLLINSDLLDSRLYVACVGLAIVVMSSAVAIVAVVRVVVVVAQRRSSSQ
jgi:hypothetical protein